MKTRTLRRIVAATAASTLLLAACGGDEETDDAGAEDTATEDTTAEDTATEGEMTEEEMTEEEMTEEEMTEEESTEGEMTEEESTEGDSTLSMEPVGEACSAIPSDGEGSSEGMADDPVATAASNNELLSTLVTAVTEAELVDTLNTTEELTVFAPVNEAFEAVDGLDEILADTETLTTILTLHVGGEQLDAEALLEAGTVTSLQGADLTVEGDLESGVTVTGPSNSANVICANIQTANATVHLIDAVLTPAA